MCSKSFLKNENFIKIFNELNTKLNPEKTSITDISENKTIIRVEGDKTTELLKKFMILNIDEALEDNLKDIAVTTGEEQEESVSSILKLASKEFNVVIFR